MCLRWDWLKHEQSPESRKQPWSSPYSPFLAVTKPCLLLPILLTTGTTVLAGSSSPPGENQVLDGFPTIPSTGHPSFFLPLVKAEAKASLFNYCSWGAFGACSLFSIRPHKYLTYCSRWWTLRSHWRWKDLSPCHLGEVKRNTASLPPPGLTGQ